MDECKALVEGLRITALVYTDGFDYNSVTVEYIDFQPIGFALVQELNVVSINFFLMYFKAGTLTIVYR